jgi:hypothetical protein
MIAGLLQDRPQRRRQTVGLRYARLTPRKFHQRTNSRKRLPSYSAVRAALFLNRLRDAPKDSFRPDRSEIRQPAPGYPSRFIAFRAVRSGNPDVRPRWIALAGRVLRDQSPSASAGRFTVKFRKRLTHRAGQKTRDMLAETQ